MKKILMIILLFIVNSFANCVIVTSPAPSNIKVTNSNMYVKQVSRVYKDENGKYQFPTFKDTLIDFYLDVDSDLEKQCKEGTIKGVYNLKTNYTVDKDYYFYSISYDYVK